MSFCNLCTTNLALESSCLFGEITSFGTEEFLFPDWYEIGTGEPHDKLTSPQEHSNGPRVGLEIIFHFQAIMWYFSKNQVAVLQRFIKIYLAGMHFFFLVYLKTSSQFTILEVFLFYPLFLFSLYALLFIFRVEIQSSLGHRRPVIL